jgi:hypothetical protein
MYAFGGNQSSNMSYVELNQKLLTKRRNWKLSNHLAHGGM